MSEKEDQRHRLYVEGTARDKFRQLTPEESKQAFDAALSFFDKPAPPAIQDAQGGALSGADRIFCLVTERDRWKLIAEKRKKYRDRMQIAEQERALATEERDKWRTKAEAAEKEVERLKQDMHLAVSNAGKDLIRERDEWRTKALDVEQHPVVVALRKERVSYSSCECITEAMHEMHQHVQRTARERDSARAQVTTLTEALELALEGVSQARRAEDIPEVRYRLDAILPNIREALAAVKERK